MTASSMPPQAELHTPEELLDNAETLLESGNPKMMRAAVLEAITALEAFVQVVVFSSLKTKLDPLLVQWLEEKTRMDFDSRLSILTPVAVGQPIDKQSSIWKAYKDAKEIRNKVTHSGRKVSMADAKFVVDTVYQWLGFLGSTVELELAMLRLKRYVEENHISIASGREAVSLIRDYFGKTKAASGAHEVRVRLGQANWQVDLILTFGSMTVAVETKFLPKESTLERRVREAVEQVKAYLLATGIIHGAVVIFKKGAYADGFETVKTYYVSTADDIRRTVYVVVISL